MVDISLGGNLNLPNTLKTTEKTKESAKVDKKEGSVNEREALAGAFQTEGKFKKEEVTRSENRFKTFQSAYKYKLGDELEEEEEIDEEMESAPLEEEDEVKETPKKETLEEIEEYDVRERFKSKVKYFLGEDFDEDEEPPPEEDEELSPEEKEKDTKQKIELSKQSFSALSQYICDTIGDFDFDNIDNLKVFVKYGIPDDAIVKFLLLQQLARSERTFPSIMDMSVIMYKLRKIGIEKTDEQVFDLAHIDYGTLKRLKYTVSGFIYVPLPEVMKKIEEDLTDELFLEFKKLLKELALENINDFSQKLSKSIMLSIKEIIVSKQKNILEKNKQKALLLQKQATLPVKNKDSLNENIENIKLEIETSHIELSNIENKIAKFIFIFSFLNSQASISDFNKQYPLELINYTLNILKVRYSEKKIQDFLKQKINIRSLEHTYIHDYSSPKTGIEIFETRVKSAEMTIGKQPAPKQQQIIKNMRNNTFETNSAFYWLKQKNMNRIIDITNEINESFNI